MKLKNKKRGKQKANELINIEKKGKQEKEEGEE